MRDSKFLSLFKTLNKSEVSAFARYLNQNYEKDQSASRLFAYVRKHYQVLMNFERLDMSDICEAIYGEVSGKNKKKILNTLSDLHLRLRDFLISERVKSDLLESKLLWLSILNERGLDAEVRRQASWLDEAWRWNSFYKEGTNEYLGRMKVSHLIYQTIRDKSGQGVENLYKFEEDLDLFYAIAKLSILCEIESLNNILGQKTSSVSGSAIENISNKYMHNDRHPLLLLYNEVYNLITTGQKEYYEKAEAILVKEVGKIDKGEVIRIVVYLQNFASSQIRKGEKEFVERTHRLNTFSVEYGIFLTPEGRMSATVFHNIVNVACAAGDIKWARKFIDEQSNFLEEETILMAKAIVLFEEEAFDRVIDILNYASFKDPLEDIRSRTLIVRSMYEIQGQESYYIESMLIDYCNSFEKLLRRNRESPKDVVSATLNFIQVLKALILKKQTQARIIQRINASKLIYYKSWLLKKASDYKKIG